jgi:hypothetical protein
MLAYVRADMEGAEVGDIAWHDTAINTLVATLKAWGNATKQSAPPVIATRRPTKPAGVRLPQDKRRPWHTDRARVSLAGWGIGGLGGTPHATRR